MDATGVKNVDHKNKKNFKRVSSKKLKTSNTFDKKHCLQNYSDLLKPINKTI